MEDATLILVAVAWLACAFILRRRDRQRGHVKLERMIRVSDSARLMLGVHRADVEREKNP